MTARGSESTLAEVRYGWSACWQRVVDSGGVDGTHVRTVLRLIKASTADVLLLRPPVAVSYALPPSPRRDDSTRCPYRVVRAEAVAAIDSASEMSRCAVEWSSRTCPKVNCRSRLGSWLMSVRQTVVSGNIRAVAELKLQVFGLDAPIRWKVGAYGEDHDVRADLVDLSLHRAHTAAADAVLIGDTPADVEGAHANGVRVIAVATGRSDGAALREAGAEVVLTDLRDTELLVKLVRSGG